MRPGNGMPQRLTGASMGVFCVNYKEFEYFLLWALLFFVIAQLAIDHLLFNIIGINKSILFKWWIIIPSYCLVVHLLTALLSFQRRELHEKLLLGFSVLLFLHAIVLAAYDGPIAGVLSFFSWGVWLGLFFFITEQRSSRAADVTAWLFVLSGILNAVPLIVEHATGQPIQDLDQHGNFERLDGIAVNQSLLGMSLAIGALASLYLVARSKRPASAVASYVLFVILVGSLGISTLRGAIIFYWIAILLIAILLDKSWYWKGLMIGSAAAAFLIATVLVFSIENQVEYYSFVAQAVIPSDQGNQVRLQLYARVWESTLRERAPFEIGRMFWGQGAGSLSHVMQYFEGKDRSTESSAIKFFLEFGFIGLGIAVASVISMLSFVVRRSSAAFNPQAVVFGAIFLVIALESMKHEFLRTWLGTFYLFATMGAWALAAKLSRQTDGDARWQEAERPR